tara:strand:+ start:16347 stop:16559 length:213 start_codon:yes stop_codon:yes gene_type:complete
MATFENYPFKHKSKLAIWQSLTLKVRRSKNISHLTINGQFMLFSTLKQQAGAELLITLKDQEKVNQLLEL